MDRLRLHVRRACAVLIVSVCTPLIGAQPADLAGKSERAREALVAGRYDEAAALYLDLVRALPDNPGLRTNLGMALHSAGKYREAIEQFSAVLKLQPDSPAGLLFLGLAHQKLGQPREAIAPLARLVKAEPNNRLALLELADAHLSSGGAEQAAPCFRRLTEVDPKAPKAWQGLGLSYVALSRRSFEALEKVAPESSYWHALLARSRAEQSKYGTAFYLYRQALAQSPGLPGIHAAIADIYRKTGHDDWAAVEEAKERTVPSKQTAAPPGSAEFHYGRALSFGKQALEAFSRLGQLPPSAEIHELTGEAWRIRGDFKQSVDEYRAALKMQPNNQRLERELAKSLWLNQEYESALPIMERMIRLDPGNAELNFMFGDVVLRTKDTEQSIPFLEKAVTLDPRLRKAHASLALACLRLDRVEQAIQHLEVALPDDEDGGLHYLLGQAHQRLGHTEAARRASEEGARLVATRQSRMTQLNAERQITPP